MIRCPTVRWTSVVALLTALVLAGCSDTNSGAFVAYDVTETAQPAASDGSNRAEPAAIETSETSPAPTSVEATANSIAETESNPNAAVVAPEPQPASEGGNGESIQLAAVSPTVEPAATLPGPTKATLPEATAVPRKVQVLVKEREFQVEGPENALRITFDDFDLLKILNMDPVTADAESHMPEWLKNLEGQRVRVRGFMYPTFTETGIEHFILARDNQICCFGRNPKIYDLVEVQLRDGVTTNYIQGRPFDIVGVFHIEAVHEGGEMFGLYSIDDAILIDR